MFILKSDFIGKFITCFLVERKVGGPLECLDGEVWMRMEI
jgi:hypothetical protein